ncbi:MAG: hypothetical protein LBH61_03860 [Dysgonamonadaceae bacterium]|jgi:hypothetical protein|nr:hypothetical protein [Dysgonamonadaceae bacterium]
MKIDLFSTTCFERKTDRFGIFDDTNQPTKPVKIVAFDDGIAKIENASSLSVYFVPLDNNIKCLRPDGNAESQCDALLICLRPGNKYDFYFVELKEVRADWITGGINQLKTTILRFQDRYNLSCLSKKAAYLANRKHPDYHFGHKEQMEKFKSETGFRLSICATVPVK